MVLTYKSFESRSDCAFDAEGLGRVLEGKERIRERKLGLPAG